MNKYQEALDFLKNINNELVFNQDYSEYSACFDCLGELQELIDKETPMKVHKQSPLKELSLGNAWFCPNCENWLIHGNNDNYCSRCGQRLEYEDD